jgi:hypothetical protein
LADQRCSFRVKDREGDDTFLHSEECGVYLTPKAPSPDSVTTWRQSIEAPGADAYSGRSRSLPASKYIPRFFPVDALDPPPLAALEVHEEGSAIKLPAKRWCPVVDRATGWAQIVAVAVGLPLERDRGRTSDGVGRQLVLLRVDLLAVSFDHLVGAH